MSEQGDWHVGDEGYYVLTKAPTNGRPQTMYLAIRVVSVGRQRVVVRTRDGRGGHKVIKARSLVTTPPTGAWVTGMPKDPADAR